MSRRPDITDETRQQMAAEYKAGYSTNEIADNHGMSCGGVHYLLKTMGVQMRPRGTRDKSRAYVMPIAGVNSLADDGLMWVQRGYVMVAVPIPQPTHPADLVACYCGAKASQACRNKKGGPASRPHATRRIPRCCPCGNSLPKVDERSSNSVKFCADECRASARRATWQSSEQRKRARRTTQGDAA